MNVLISTTFFYQKLKNKLFHTIVKLLLELGLILNNSDIRFKKTVVEPHQTTLLHACVRTCL